MPDLDRDTLLRRLTEARTDLFGRYPLRRLALFGSVARGEAEPGSDIDVLVEFSRPVGFEVAELAMDLDRLLEGRVDLVSAKAIRSAMRPYVERDAIDV